MLNIFSRKTIIQSLLLASIAILPTYVLAQTKDFSSYFMNQSKQTGSNGYTLVKTRVWPESKCVINSGKAILLPGESTQLVVANKKECDQAGVGYSMYKAEDKKNEHLLGYVSHRFRDGKFSLQVSVFCESDKCIFKDLNPDQKQRK